MQDLAKQLNKLSIEVQATKPKFGILHDQTTLIHKPAKSHPECPERITSILAALADTIKNNSHIQQITSCPPISSEVLTATHGPDYVDFVLNMWPQEETRRKQIYINVDTYFMKDTMQSAKVAANAAIVCVQKVVKQKKWAAGFAFVRPPGHHSGLKNQPHGFCFFNNAAIAANYAIKECGLERVLILDWDAHHGEGTQNLFYKSQKVMYASLHRYDKGTFFPNMKQSACEMSGAQQGRGFNINIAWNTNIDKKTPVLTRQNTCGDNEYAYAFERVLLPVIKQWKPELIIISSGFDAAQDDPLGGMCVTEAGYSYMSMKLQEVCPSVVAVLEGGYNLESLGWAARSVVTTLAGCRHEKLIENVNKLQEGFAPNEIGISAVKETVEVHAKFWPILNHKDLVDLELNKVELLKKQEKIRIETAIQKQKQALAETSKSEEPQSKQPTVKPTANSTGIITRSKARELEKNKQ